MSWEERDAGQFGKTTAFVHILNPGMEPPPRRSNFELSVAFWDRNQLDFGETFLAWLFGGRPKICTWFYDRLIDNNDGWPWRPPLTYDARRIRSFVDSVPSTYDFAVACEYGRRRSRAVAEWIAYHRGIVAAGDRSRGQANPLLADLLFER